ncbi:MAG: hypothetical protein ACXAEF_12385 [Candidatus Thorarchaeota archaeon]|jgi:hypothetical protein
MVKLTRFGLPIIFAAVGWAFAFFLVREIARDFGDLVTYNMTDLLPGNIAQEITILLGFIPLAGIIVYIFLGVFIASILLLAAKIARTTAYDLDIIQTGRDFGGMRMIRRAAVPAVFAVAFSGLISGTITNLLFSALENVPEPAQLLWQALSPIMGVLVTLPIVLAIFMPTWILNDAGIVMHLKDEQLNVRRCPDTIGVGRWWSNLLAGFTLFTIPIVSFIQHFLPLIVIGETSIIPYFWSFVITLGIPFLAMTFIMPVVVFNEIFISLSKRAIRWVARALGAREMKLETIVTETKIVDKGPKYGWSMKEGKNG